MSFSNAPHTKAAVAQFIVSDFIFQEREIPVLRKIARCCETHVSDAVFESVKNKEGCPGVLVSIGFEIDEDTDGNHLHRSLSNISRLLLERFLGLLSFALGIQLRGLHLQFTILHEGGGTKTIRPSNRTGESTRNLDFPVAFTSGVLPLIDESVFNALFWFRRGLAQQDSINTFNALVTCLEILSKRLVHPLPVVMDVCGKCGEKRRRDAGAMASLKALLRDVLKCDDDIAGRIIRARNAITVHGGKAVNSEILADLTDLKFETATLACSALSIALEMDPNDAPVIRPEWFITDSDLYLD